MLPQAARWLAASLLALSLPALAAAAESFPLDAHGRPLADALGPIRYRGAGEGPAHGSAAAGGGRRKSHSSYTLTAYSARAVGSSPEAVAVGDVTGDGRNDVVLTTTFGFDAANDYQVFVFPQLGDGTLGTAAKHPYGASASRNGIALADLDEDGVLDVVVGHASGISVLLADGSGGLLPARLIADADADTLAATDIDRDGHVDLVSLGWSRGATRFFGNGTGAFPVKRALATNASGYNDHEVEDLSGEGAIDLAVMSGQLFATPNLSVHRHDGAQDLLAASDTYRMGSNELSAGVGLGDVTGDGRHDAVLSRDRNSPTWLWIMSQDGAGRLTGPATITSYDIPEAVEVADLDGDGGEDVAVVHGGWNRVGIYLQMPGGGLEAEVLHDIPYASHYAPQGLALGDFSGDGCGDVAIADYNNGLVVLYGRDCEAPCAAPPTAVAGGPPYACAGSWATLTGSGSSGCSGDALRFRWLEDNVQVCGWSATPTCDVRPAAEREWTLEVACASSRSCRGADRLTLPVKPVPLASAGADRGICLGEAVQLTGASPSSCPTGESLAYRWLDGTAEICPWSPSPDCVAAPAANATYTLDAACSGSAECMGSDAVTVAVDARPMVDAGPDGVACSARPLTLGAAGAPACSNGSPRYRWLEGAREVCAWSDSPSCTTAPAAGTYRVEAACSLNLDCRGEDQVAVSLAQAPQADAGGDFSSCAGFPVTLTGASPSSCASGELRYRWLDGLTEVCPWSDRADCDVRPSASTAYTLEVACSDALGCAGSDLVVVTAPAAPAAAAGPDRSTCAGLPLTLTGSSPSVCPSGSLLYRWVEGASERCAWSPSPACDVAPAATTVYTLEVTCSDTPACIGSDTLVVTLGGPVADAGSDLTFCAGRPLTLAGSTPTACASGSLLYRWLDGGQPVCDWSPEPACEVTPAGTTAYTLEVACSDAPGCVGRDSLLAVPDPDLRPGDLGNTLRAVRAGASVQLVWGADLLARSYALYRHTDKESWPPDAYRTGLPAPDATEPDIDAPPRLFYRAAGASCSGLEGP